MHVVGYADQVDIIERADLTQTDTFYARRRSGGVVWFGFAALCESARSAADYAVLARDFHTVFLTRVPVLDEQHEDAARRFIALVDEFYDQGVKLNSLSDEPEAAVW